MEDDHPSSRVPSWVRYEFKDGVPQGDLPPPERLRRVLWDRTAYNRGQLVKLARTNFRLNYKHTIDTDTLAQEVHVYCSNWEKQNPGWQTWWSGRSAWGKFQKGCRIAWWGYQHFHWLLRPCPRARLPQ